METRVTILLLTIASFSLLNAVNSEDGNGSEDNGFLGELSQNSLDYIGQIEKALKNDISQKCKDDLKVLSSALQSNTKSGAHMWAFKSKLRLGHKNAAFLWLISTMACVQCDLVYLRRPLGIWRTLF